MTDSFRRPAPDAIGDIVDGEPPVPITVWSVPAADGTDTVSSPLAQRLIANFTHPRDLVLDLTTGSQLAQAASAARRRHRRGPLSGRATGRDRAALLVTGLPGRAGQARRLAGYAARLRPGGCVAVVLGDAEVTFSRDLILAARAAGLTYLQHIVAAHELPGRAGAPGAGGTHVRVHTDVYAFSKPDDGDADA